MTRFLSAVVPALLLAVALAAPPLASQSSPPRARTRTYFIAAEQVTWDYVPGGRDEIAGTLFADTAFFAKAPPRPVSTVYKKVLYREYTDSSFRTLKPRPPEWEHLGFLGPVIHAVVGDTIRVVFRNNGRRPFSIHPHGVFYEKSSEGVPYNDGTSGADKADDAVAPGATYTYVWPVPARAGPAPMDGSSVMWMYHSHVDEVRDIDSGLMGHQRLRFSLTALARQHDDHQRHAYRRHVHRSDGDGGGRHDSRRCGDVAFPLPHLLPQRGGNGCSVPGAPVGDRQAHGA